MEFFTDGADRSYSYCTGYLNKNDNMHRLITISFKTAGRYLSDVYARMSIDGGTFSDCVGSVYINKIFGQNCF